MHPVNTNLEGSGKYTYTLSPAWINSDMKATAYTLIWCFDTSITTCNSNEAKGILDLYPKYEKIDKIAMMVKMIAPACDMNSISYTVMVSS